MASGGGQGAMDDGPAAGRVPGPLRRRPPAARRSARLRRPLLRLRARPDQRGAGRQRRRQDHPAAADRRPLAAGERQRLRGRRGRDAPLGARALPHAGAHRHALPGRRAARLDDDLRERGAAPARALAALRAGHRGGGDPPPGRGGASRHREPLSPPALGRDEPARGAGARDRDRSRDRALRRAVLGAGSDQRAPHRGAAGRPEPPARAHHDHHLAPPGVFAADGGPDRVPGRRPRDRRHARGSAAQHRQARASSSCGPTRTLPSTRRGSA